MTAGSEWGRVFPVAGGGAPLRFPVESGHRAIPIFLFSGLSDSVGAWGEFPSLLSRATGHMVVVIDQPMSERSGLLAGRPRFDSTEPQRQIDVHAGFARFIACGYDLGGPIAADAAARSEHACLGLIAIRSRAGDSPALPAFSTTDLSPKPRCPTLVVHGDLSESEPKAGAKQSVVAAIRDFLTLSVFPLPIH